MTTPKSNGYEYRTLQRSRNEIRLLKLLPSDGNGKLKDIPACHMFHAALHEHPKFVARSYVWGTTDVRVTLVENSMIRVTKNLYDAIMVRAFSLLVRIDRPPFLDLKFAHQTYKFIARAAKTSLNHYRRFGPSGRC